MTRAGAYNEQQAATLRLSPWMIKLLLPAAVTLDRKSLLADLRAVCGHVDALGEDEPLTGVVYRDYTSDVFDQRDVPCAHSFIVHEGADEQDEALDLALGQTWDWNDARDAASRAKATLFLIDMMATALEPKRRLDVFVKAARVLVAHTNALAIHWLPSQRVVPPERFRGETDLGLTTAAVNIRMFRVEDRAPGEIVMDSLGMAAFGLPDVQCRYAGHDPSRVAARLFQYVEYIFERGDVIADGHTVDGVDPGTRWRCQHETALVAPERNVVDMDTGSSG